MLSILAQNIISHGFAEDLKDEKSKVVRPGDRNVSTTIIANYRNFLIEQ